MSLAQEIKNYIEFFNLTSSNPSENFTITTSIIIFIKYNFFYLVQLVKNFIIYIFSFNWFFDFLQIPVLIPKWYSSNLRELYSLQNPNNFLYSYTSSWPFTNNGFVYLVEGFFTSFFLCIPNSTIHILLLRRLIVEGIPAGIAAAGGTIMAQFFFLLMVTSGFRFVIFSWFSLEPITYILGIGVILILVYKLSHTSIKRIRKNDFKKLISIFFINFLLVWTEQYGIFPYFNSLTINAGSSFIETGTINSWVNHSGYFMGFLIGSCFWLGALGILCLKLSQFFAQTLVKSYSQWIQKFNFVCLTFIISFSLASFPYYGLDYLFFSPLGFHSEDDLLLPFILKTDIKDVQKGRLGEYSAHSSIDTDVAPFDRGRYSTGSEIELTFEDMNFQGEYIWRSRSDRVASGSAGIVNKFMSKFLPKTSTTSSTAEATSLIKPSDSGTKEEMDEFSSANMQSFSNSNYLESPFIYKDNYESFLERFLTDYNSEVKDPSLPDTSGESETFSAFSELVKYGFDSFASLEEVESDEFEEELGKKIKQKYYNNIIYKCLVTLDIKNFLRRQPDNYFLTEQEENLLFEKRLILNNYYNSLRSYTQLPYSEVFQNLFGGTKSYANRVYNQQYKGTLKILRRLFLIDIDPQKSFLKYDQLLFRDPKQNNNLFFHEELQGEVDSVNGESPKDPDLEILSTSSTKLKQQKKESIETEERQFASKKRLFAKKNLGSSLQETQINPFYVGWDNTLRKFVVTNRLYITKDLFLKKNIRAFTDSKLSQNKKLTSIKSSKPKLVNFSTWPLQQLNFEENKQNARFLFQKFNNSQSDLQKDLFEYAESGDYETRLIYDTLPGIVQRIDLRNKDKTNIKLKPNRGGFIWYSPTLSFTPLKNSIDSTKS
uniref:Ycf78 n=1 Tax=Lambia antarctica TaxID=101717 RepID=A0A1L2EDY2_9CHLO|nr:Ycf78 [Lambia antarctica]ANN39063.1 Ycf78 [Lambia antarctica]